MAPGPPSGPPGGTIVAVEPQAVRWSGAGYATLQNLGTLPGATSIDSRANAVSPDGAVVVGRALDASDADRAFLWDEAHGMRELAAVLADDYGLDVSGWVLSEALGLSQGVGGAFTVVGQGINPQGDPEGWVAHLPEPGGLALLAPGILALAAIARVDGRRRGGA